MIYLFPPSPIPDAIVSVSLAPQWSFSHVYHLVVPKWSENWKQHVQWLVSARQDRTPVEKDTKLELSYLFWEAESNFAPPTSPLSPADARGYSEDFDPAYPELDCNSPTVVLLPLAELLPYLDSTLKQLWLHAAARNDFITYWLPKLSKKPFVALRFLPQAAYERAAELEVEPKPDVVTRVFMLFADSRKRTRIIRCGRPRELASGRWTGSGSSVSTRVFGRRTGSEFQSGARWMFCDRIS